MGIVGVQRRAHRALNDLLFVVSGNEHRDRRLVRRVEGRPPANAIEDGQRANQHQARAHQHIADEEDEDDEHREAREQGEAEAVDPCRPLFPARQRRHHVGPRLAQQIRNRNQLVTFGAQLIDDDGERLHGFAAVTAAVMQKNDVAALEIAGFARRQVGHHVLHNLVGGAPGIIVPVIGIDFVADGDEAHVLRQLKRAHLVGGVGLLVDGVRRTEQDGLHTQFAFEQALGKVQLDFEVALTDVADVGMGEGVIADLVAFVVDALGDGAVLFRLNADQEERGLNVLLLQHIEHLGRPLGVGPIVEGNRDFLGRAAVHIDFVRRRHGLEDLVADQLGIGINYDLALAWRGLAIDPQDLALAFDVDVLAGGHSLQFVRRIGVARLVPHCPERAVLGAQAPQGEGVDAQLARAAHFVERGYAVEEPDVVPDIVLVEISEVRVLRIVVEVDVGVGVFGLKPCFLYRDVVHVGRRSSFLLTFLHGPVVTVVTDRRDDLLARDHLQRVLQVVEEPILAGDGPGLAARIVLVVVHQDDAVSILRDCGVAEIFVVDRDSDVELETLSVQVAVEFLHQREVVSARGFGEGFDVEGYALVLIGGEKRHELAAEALPRRRVGHKLRGRVGVPLVADGVIVVDQGQDFHRGLFTLEERHHLLVHRTGLAFVHEVEERVLLGHAL